MWCPALSTRRLDVVQAFCGPSPRTKSLGGSAVAEAQAEMYRRVRSGALEGERFADRGQQAHGHDQADYGESAWMIRYVANGAVVDSARTG